MFKPAAQDFSRPVRTVTTDRTIKEELVSAAGWRATLVTHTVTPNIKPISASSPRHASECVMHCDGMAHAALPLASVMCTKDKQRRSAMLVSDMPIHEHRLALSLFFPSLRTRRRGEKGVYSHGNRLSWCAG
ncbi:hypothetical protein Baya_16780 [Bagarius yarrelli]|uniref:Uncharacterized protein n=1 Tax=Bagarius yarrelli TaxID=175774 RepID=A0A556VWF0_BAGYA|nr:hypothetical protein Baya_16780 [Bagarius yarrelli]